MSSTPTKEEFEELGTGTELVEALEKTPFTFFVPKKYTVSLAVPYNLSVYPNNLVLKNGIRTEDNVNIENELINLIGKEEAEMNFIKFNSFPGSNDNEITIDLEHNLPQLSSFEKHILSTVTHVDDKAYTDNTILLENTISSKSNDVMGYISNILNKKSSPIKRKNEQEEKGGVFVKKVKTETKNSNQNTNFNYSSSMDHIISKNLNVNGATEIIRQIINTEKSDSDCWEAFNFLFDPMENKWFVKDKHLSQLKGYIQSLCDSKSLNELDSTSIEKIQDFLFDTVNSALEVDWFQMSHSMIPDELDSYFQFSTKCITCLFILIDLLFNTGNIPQFIENKMNIIWKVFILFGKEFYQFYKLEMSINNLPMLKQLLEDYTKLVDKLSFLVLSIEIEEGILGELEYVFTNLIFADLKREKKEKEIIFNTLEYLRYSASNVLVSIFHKYPDQRDFILNDLVDRFTALPTLKSKVKQYRLGFGVSVSVFSILIVRLPSLNNNLSIDIDPAYWKILEIPQKAKSEIELISQIETSFVTVIQKHHEAITKITDHFAHLLLKKIVAELGADLKKVLDVFFNDILTILNYPDFPTCEYLLTSIMNMMIKISMSDLTPANIQAYCLEIIGKMVSKVLIIKNNHHIDIVPLNITEKNFKLVHNNYVSVLTYLKEKNEGSYIQLFAKYMWILHKSLQEYQIESKAKDESFINVLKNCISELSAIFWGSESLKLTAPEQSISEIIGNYEFILLTQNFSKGFTHLLYFTIGKLNDNKVKTRASAVKSITLLIDKDPLLLSNQNLKQTIENRLAENYAQVNDSILELLDKYLNSNPEQIETYFLSICNKVMDPKLSVKRRAIKLASRLYNLSTNKSVKMKVCEVLLAKLVDEEDSMVTLASECLMDLWFLQPANYYFETQDSTNKTIKLSMCFDEIISIMINISNLGENWWVQFERFIKERIFYKGRLVNKNFKFIKVSSQQLINRILELVTEVHVGNFKKDDLMALLAVFVKADCNLITQNQLLSLQPYIIDDKSSGSKLCYYTLQVFNMSLNNGTKNLDDKFVETCWKSLLTRITRFYANELTEAMQCMWKLAKNNHRLELLAKASIKILRMLLTYSKNFKSGNLKFIMDHRLRRLIFLIGNFAKYCNFERVRYLFLEANIGLRKESITTFILNNILVYCDTSLDTISRVDSIKNALGICITHPRAFRHPHIISLMDSSFKKKDENIKIVVITAIASFMKRVEIQSNERNGLENKISDEIEIDEKAYHGESTETESDAICSNLVQKYFESILGCCLVHNEELSIIAIKFLQFSVKFGFAIPMLCFPTISALECSRFGYIKQLAIEMHQKLFEKYSSLIESCYIPAFKLAIKNATSLYPGLNIIRSQTYFKYFTKLVKDHKSQMKIKKLYDSIQRLLVKTVSMIEFENLNSEQVKDRQQDVAFLALNLKEIEYSTLNEVLNVVNIIDKILITQSSTVLQPYKLIFDENDKDIHEWFKYQIMAKCLIMLHRVKICLMNNYGVNDKLLLKYQELPNAKEFKIPTKLHDESQLKIDDLDLTFQSTGNKFFMTLCGMLTDIME
ncbi:hypothetical protein DAMA08_005730 [Martiniozyma asiatica (nom. inval.)]|nr:hypothetical protein DAMA08_005730 [Martiniozyma asiatica]